jgi:hypothetical protein
MGNGEFDTTDASYVSLTKLREDLDRADQVNGQVIRLCCKLYRLAWEAGVDPTHPEMQEAAEQLKGHRCWDDTWNDGARKQSSDGADERSG